MNQTTSHLVQNLSALVGLLAVTIVFAALHDSAHAGEALAAFVGYAAGSRSTHPVLAGAAPVVAAGAVALLLSGCSPAQLGTGFLIAEEAVKVTCDGAHKLCDAGHSDACDAILRVCDVLSPTSGGSVPQPSP